MCGISAIYKFSRITREDVSKLESMNREMHYRGPDENGVWNDDKCGLAHTRLSIIGLENGHQPIVNEDKSLVLVCCGEIYNYKELRGELLKRGHVFYTKSDSEVICHVYEEYGTECLAHLRGMFAFCLWDKKNKRLFIARDRVGEKTLYYSHCGDSVVVSTELKAINKYNISSPEFDFGLLAEIIRHNYPIDLQNTFVKQIKRLKAGEYAIIDEQGISTSQYWNRYNKSVFEGSRDDAISITRDLLKDSVEGCLQSDVPVAVLLSGGIDSSAIAAFAKETGKEIHGITAGYKGNMSVDERQIARQYARDKGLIYHEVELDLSDFRDIFNEYTSFLDEPVADLSSIPQWALYKKAKELGFTVLLSGIGGDELFYGYPSHNSFAQKMELKSHLNHFRFNKFINEALYSLKNFNLKYLIPTDRWPTDWTYRDYKRFVSNATVRIAGKEDKLKRHIVDYCYPADTDIDTVYDLLFSRFMSTNCLYLADREGMGNSLEIRSPFMDYRLIEFVSSLPIEMKYTKGKPKQFLKDVLAGIVPDNILYAKKRGFTPPRNYINLLCKEYRYSIIDSDYVFFNSMLADVVLKNTLNK